VKDNHQDEEGLFLDLQFACDSNMDKECEFDERELEKRGLVDDALGSTLAKCVMVGCRACRQPTDRIVCHQRHHDDACGREPPPSVLSPLFWPSWEDMARSAHHMEREEIFTVTLEPFVEYVQNRHSGSFSGRL
jgi:hypothetical protein